MRALARRAPTVEKTHQQYNARIGGAHMTIETAPNTALMIQLRDGRTLGYAEYGDPAGKPAFMFHGFPGARLESAMAHESAAQHGVRLISIDRPGYGLSDFKPGRAFLDWPNDVVELATALGIDRFGVAGVSGGGPYVAACAYAIPERLTSICIISGVGPFDAPGATEGMGMQNKLLFGLGRRAPWLGGLVIRVMARTAKNASDKFIDQMAKAMPEPDRVVLQRPDIRAMMLADVRESFRQGSRGAVHELLMYARPWGFRLQDITAPVHLWQGTADKNVSPAMGRYQASAIPDCQATFCEGEGHLLVVTHMDEITAVMAT
jgi:pimeloyl-ACP methyl ester carboxylesterase